MQVLSVDESGRSEELTLEVVVENGNDNEVLQQSCSSTSESTQVMLHSKDGPTPERCHAESPSTKKVNQGKASGRFESNHTDRISL
jgi:hypothetical protein